MKSLKRTLCLVLALVMVLGLFGVASASKFTDDNTIQYKEAVDVMTGIGAISGYPNGTFDPKGTITRAEAAKLVVYTMLGKTAAENQLSAGTTSSFTDVTAPAYNWAIPSIEYLVKTGAINGRGDGTFDPDGNITSYELGKLLLCAIGYGAKNEYVGAGWDLQVTIDGSRVGPVSYGADRRLSVFSNRATTAGSLSAPATREEAALYCFNTIQKLKVEYVAALDIYADGTNSLGVAQGSIGTNIYPTLTRPGAGDIFGNPGYQWKFGGVELYSTTVTPIVTFTAKKTVNDLKKAVVSAGYNWVNGVDGSGAARVTVLVNDTVANVGSNLTDLTADIGGDGLLLRAYADSNRNLYLVTVINTYVGQVTNITPDSASTADIDERALEVTLLDGTTKITASPIDGTVGFDAAYTASKTMMDAGNKMFLIVAPKGTTALSVEIPTVTELKVSSITKDKTATNVESFVADGKSYSFAANTPNVVKNSVQANSTYTVLTNEYGYVVLVDLVTANKNVGVVVKSGTTPAAFGDIPTVKVVTTSGEKVDLQVSQLNTDTDVADITTAVADDAYSGKIVEYVPDTGANAGKYKVTSIGKPGTNPVEIADSTQLGIKTGQTIIGGAAPQTTAAIVTALSGLTANNQTVFIIGTEGTTGPIYTVYTGVDNVPDLTATGVSGAEPVYNYSVVKNPQTGADTNVAAVFYVSKCEVDPDTTKLSFLALGSDPTTLADGSVVYKSAIISGKTLADIKEVWVPATLITPVANGVGVYDVKNSAAVPPFISEYKTEEQNGLTVLSEVSLFATGDKIEAKMGIGAKAPDKGLVGLGDSAADISMHTYTNDCSVWLIDPSKGITDGKFVNGNINKITDGPANRVFWLQNKTTGQVSDVYVVKNDQVTYSGIASKTTGVDSGTVAPTTAGAVTYGGSVTVTVTVPASGITKLTPVVTGGGTPTIKYVITSGGTAGAETTWTSGAITVAANDSVAVTISNITKPITAVTFTAAV